MEAEATTEVEDPERYVPVQAEMTEAGSAG